MRSSLIRFLSLLAAAAAVSCASAQDSSGGWYFGGDAGINLTNHLAPSNVPGYVSTSAGPRVDISLGYMLPLAANLSLGIEGQTGLLYNSISSAHFENLSASVSGSYIQVPVLANAVLNFVASGFTLYAGAGVGADHSRLGASSLIVVGTGSETDAAYDFSAGIRRGFGSNSSWGLGYQYLATRPGGLNTIVNQGFVASILFRF